MAGAFDLFGNGKTALKVAANRYLESMAAGFASEFNPMTPKFESRLWTDSDRNNSILDANGNIQFNEVSPGSANFGAYSATRRPDEDLRRGYNWEQSVAIEHELMPRIAVTVGYYRRQYRNLRVVDNLNVATSDWTPFDIQGPSDSRFPTGGGEAITMHSLNAAKVLSAVDEISTFSTSNDSVYNGFEINGNARFGKGFLFGGVTTQRTTRSTCDVRDNPNNFRFCDNAPPFRTVLKASTSYEFKYGVQASASYYGTPGSDVAANYTVTGAIAGRPISGGVGDTSNQIVVNLIEPNTLFLDYINQLDARVGKTFRFGRFQAQGFVDVFNVLNAGTVLSVVTTYGANPATRTWMNPASLMAGRTVRFGTQWEF
jgi:hypothetical protein